VNGAVETAKGCASGIPYRVWNASRGVEERFGLPAWPHKKSRNKTFLWSCLE
jgi:hypothetical protein